MQWLCDDPGKLQAEAGSHGEKMMLDRVVRKLTGKDPKMERLVGYWGVTFLLYVMFLAVLWLQVGAGLADRAIATGFTWIAVGGNACFYFLIRSSRIMGLTPAQLSVYQGRFAIVVACVGYTALGPVRGAVLVGLMLILMFCAFTLPARKAHSLSIFAVVLLGVSMIAMLALDPRSSDARTEFIHFVLVGTMVIVVGTLTGRMSDLRATLRQQKEELAEALVRIRELASRDELTHLPNRRFMLTHLQTEERVPATAPTCLAIMDIDHFKHVNDTYGHAAGDEVLRRFAEEGSRILRPSDVLARWGGEEFLLLLPNTDLASAERVLERIRSQTEHLAQIHDGLQFSVTVSAGVVELAPREPHANGISRADALLYLAKSQGRNRVISRGAHSIDCGVSVPPG
jgi:diguanylate cyclase